MDDKDLIPEEDYYLPSPEQIKSIQLNDPDFEYSLKVLVFPLIFKWSGKPVKLYADHGSVWMEDFIDKSNMVINKYGWRVYHQWEYPQLRQGSTLLVDKIREPFWIVGFKKLKELLNKS